MGRRKKQIEPDQPQIKSKPSDLADSHFDLSIAYRLLIGAYIRSADKAPGTNDESSKSN